MLRDIEAELQKCSLPSTTVSLEDVHFFPSQLCTIFVSCAKTTPIQDSVEWIQRAAAVESDFRCTRSALYTTVLCVAAWMKKFSTIFVILCMETYKNGTPWSLRGRCGGSSGFGS